MVTRGNSRGVGETGAVSLARSAAVLAERRITVNGVGAGVGGQPSARPSGFGDAAETVAGTAPAGALFDDGGVARGDELGGGALRTVAGLTPDDKPRVGSEIAFHYREKIGIGLHSLRRLHEERNVGRPCGMAAVELGRGAHVEVEVAVVVNEVFGFLWRDSLEGHCGPMVAFERERSMQEKQSTRCVTHNRERDSV